VIDKATSSQKSMSNHLDYFSDLLGADECIRAALAGPGVDVDGASVWYQIAVTEHRVLVVDLRTKEAAGNYQPFQRLVADRSAVQMERFPESEDGPARLIVDGLSQPVVVVDINRNDVFPMVEPLIVAWGGRLGGAGTGKPNTPTPTPTPTPPMPDQQKLLLVALGCAGLLMAFCACAGCLGGIAMSVQDLL
jgi:hypothetical protein